MTEEKYVSGEEHQAMSRSGRVSANRNRVTIQTQYFVWAAVVILSCFIGFIGGVNYQKHHSNTITPTTASTTGGFSGQSGGFGGRRGGGFGQVTTVTASSISVANQRTGTTKTYTVNSSTTITNSGQVAALSDIQTGDTVIITVSSTDSTLATAIVVNPSFGEAPSAATNNSATTQSN